MIETDGLVGRRARDTVYSVCIVRWWCILPSALSKHTHTHDSMPESSTELWSQLWTKLKLSYERGGEEKKTWLSILATAKRVNIFPHWRKKVVQFFFSFCNFALIALILYTAWYFRIYLMFLLKVTARKKIKQLCSLDERKIAIRFVRV